MGRRDRRQEFAASRVCRAEISLCIVQCNTLIRFFHVLRRDQLAAPRWVDSVKGGTYRESKRPETEMKSAKSEYRPAGYIYIDCGRCGGYGLCFSRREWKLSSRH
jgi:hypothetical protein